MQLLPRHKQAPASLQGTVAMETGQERGAGAGVFNATNYRSSKWVRVSSSSIIVQSVEMEADTGDVSHKYRCTKAVLCNAFIFSMNE